MTPMMVRCSPVDDVRLQAQFVDALDNVIDLGGSDAGFQDDDHGKEFRLGARTAISGSDTEWEAAGKFGTSLSVLVPTLRVGTRVLGFLCGSLLD